MPRYIANCRPFPWADLDKAAALNLAILADSLDKVPGYKLMALRTRIDISLSANRCPPAVP